MKNKDKNGILPNLTNADSQDFPLRWLYFVLIILLTVFSLVSFSIQTTDIGSNLWGLSAEIKVNSLTLTLLFLAWLPLLIPWIIQLSPRIRNFLSGLREGGVEEIEAGILKIKLTAGIQRIAEVYENRVQESAESPVSSVNAIRAFEDTYNETLKLLLESKRLDSFEAMKRIDQLSAYYDRVREVMPSSRERTRLMVNISSTMWSLMPSIRDFPVSERLNSSKGGDRLSAYKFLEWKPSDEYLNLLLSRAIGILEEPFGQYGALLALRRMVTVSSLNQSQRQLVSQTIGWVVNIDYMGLDRRKIMNTIILSLNQNE